MHVTSLNIHNGANQQSECISGVVHFGKGRLQKKITLNLETLSLLKMIPTPLPPIVTFEIVTKYSRNRILPPSHK